MRLTAWHDAFLNAVPFDETLAMEMAQQFLQEEVNESSD